MTAHAPSSETPLSLTSILVVREQTSFVYFAVFVWKFEEMAESQIKTKGQRIASGCRHFTAEWDSHHFCWACRDKKKGDDVCVTSKEEDCYICLQFSSEQKKKLKAKKAYQLKKAKEVSKDLEDSLLGSDDPPSSTPATNSSSDPNAMAVDALNISWQALDGYVYCPVALIPKVVQKMRTYACRMIVVAPGWPGMSWFWDLIELSTKPPLLLPHWETLLRQPFSHRFHQNLQYLNLHVWHLDSRQNHLKNSISQWQRELRHLRDFHQEGSMNQGGPFLSHGANRARWSSKNLLFPQ